MKVKVRPLRKEGRLVASRDTPDAPGFAGNLMVEEKRDHTSGRTLAQARLIGIASGQETDLLPELLDVRLLWARDSKLRMTGFERLGGIEYSQTWSVEVVAC